MNRRAPAKDLLSSSDPLSDEACQSLIFYREEDELVDFKESFDPAANSKSWIDLAVDCAAFANTHGGYIVLGVRDRTWELVGLRPEVASALADIKKTLEKVNRGLVPPITSARARQITQDGMEFVVLAVTANRSYTHIFETDIAWKNHEGKSISGVRQGTIYVRRSGSNAILTSADFERLVDRRLQQFREKVFEGMTRVINAPPGHETVTVVLDTGRQGQRSVKVTDAPDALDLSGKALTLRVDSVLDKINMMIAITRTEADPQIDVRILYGLYAAREGMSLSTEQRDWVTEHSLRNGVPAFYWLRQAKEAGARELISAAFDVSKFWRRAAILNYAGFYGERFHARLYQKLGEAGPANGIRVFKNKPALFNVTSSEDPMGDSELATELARSLAVEHDAQSQRELERFDCALYAPFD